METNARQEHTKLWLIAAMISLCVNVVSDMLKIVGVSALLKCSDAFYDSASQTLQSIAHRIVEADQMFHGNR